MSETYYDLNVYLPGSVINLPVIDWSGEQAQEEFRVERVGKDEISKSGYAGEIYHLVHLASREEVALKILGSGKLRKAMIALLSRLFLCLDFAWSLVEVKLAILNHVLLPKAVKQRVNKDLLVGSWRRSYTFAKGKPALLLPWEDLRDARNVPLSGVGNREIKERAKVSRFLISFFKGIGADAFAWQFNHTRYEPWGRWYIVLTAIIASLTLGITYFCDLPYDPKVNVLVFLCVSFTFAGASWLTASNLKKRLKDGSFCGPDLVLGIPHIGMCIPTAMAVGCCLLILQKVLHLTNDWVLFLALVPSPGYLFLFEIPLFLYQLFCKGYPIPLSQLHIRDFAREFGFDRDFKDDVVFYRELLAQFEAGRLNPINRLCVFLFVLVASPNKKYILMYALLSFLGRRLRDKIVASWSVQGKVGSDFAFRMQERLLPFSWSELRLRGIERWEQKGKITPSQGKEMRAHLHLYLVFLVVSLGGIIPWRFILDQDYYRHRIASWKVRHIEKMCKSKQIIPRQGRDLAAQGISFSRIAFSFFLLRKLYRFCFDRIYRKRIARNVRRYFSSKEFIQRRAIARFRRYVYEQKTKGRIAPKYYLILKKLETDEDVHLWLILYYALITPKAFTWPARILAAIGFAIAQRITDLLSYMPAWLGAFIVTVASCLRLPPQFVTVITGAMGIAALYEIGATLVLGGVFRLRIVHYRSIERHLAARLAVLILLNIPLFIAFACLNGIPSFSILSIPLLVSVVHSQLAFALLLLMLVRWQSLSLKGVRGISLGMWDEGGTGEYYFSIFLIATFFFLSRKFLMVLKWLKRKVV